MPRKRIQPGAFLCYARADDDQDGHRISELKEALAAQISLQIGKPFEIFQDRTSTEWGRDWKRWIDGALGEVMFLIPVLSPSFFNSKECTREFREFRKREKALGRNDLVLPIYYIDTPLLDGSARPNTIAFQLAKYQRIPASDWRSLRIEPMTSYPVRHAIIELATEFRSAMTRSESPPATPTALSSKVRQKPSESSDEPLESTIIQGSVELEPKDPPALKAEPRTIIVDQMHRGDFPSIAAALDECQPGDTLMVRRGLYKDPLVISKPVEILGEGDPSDVVVAVSGETAIQFQSSMGRLAGLTIKQVDGEFSAVWITQGRLDIEDCDITSDAGAGIVVSGGADPRVRRCRAHHCGQSGIQISAKSLGLYEENEVFENRRAGFSCGASNPVIRSNIIRNNTESGIFFHTNSKGTVEANSIFSNSFHGISLRGQASPQILRNDISGNSQFGLSFTEGSRGTTTDNDIHNNDAAGVSIVGPDTGPLLTENRIYENKAQGVVIGGGGDPRLERNEIYDHKGSNIDIGSSKALVRDNKIFRSEEDGIWLFGDLEGVRIEANHIFENLHNGLMAHSTGAPSVTRNIINKNGFRGITVVGGNGTYKGNDLRENYLGAFYSNEYGKEAKFEENLE